ncbi:TauD/TfdA family dioxygenase [Mycolicibacterium hippocampi]|uniref:TauD/TfdA dioxygenase family protein n=1 Tax=Mycobacteriaceae TaxID=1762 RepID=UPI0021170C45|nr:TauD/TfdA family dioxygenase [Mycolicibacterium hippocampi]
MPDITTMTPTGVRINDFRVGALDEHAVADLRRLLAEHGVVVMPSQDIDDRRFLEFLRSFGPTMFTVGETPVPGFPELNVISNVGRTTPPRSTFHTDTSYVRKPPSYTALRAVHVPARGGHTLFTNQYTAYETLPADFRDDLAGRHITHVVTGLDLGADDETSAVHPIVRVHPISRRRYLYLSAPGRCAQVSGMSAEQAGVTIARLFEHCTHHDNVLRHAWAPGDVVMWDNRCVLHRADHDGVVGDRVFHRGMVVEQQ